MFVRFVQASVRHSCEKIASIAITVTCEVSEFKPCGHLSSFIHARILCVLMSASVSLCPLCGCNHEPLQLAMAVFNWKGGYLYGVTVRLGCARNPNGQDYVAAGLRFRVRGISIRVRCISLSDQEQTFM